MNLDKFKIAVENIKADKEKDKFAFSDVKYSNEDLKQVIRDFYRENSEINFSENIKLGINSEQNSVYLITDLCISMELCCWSTTIGCTG